VCVSTFVECYRTQKYVKNFYREKRDLFGDFNTNFDYFDEELIFAMNDLILIITFFINVSFLLRHGMVIRKYVFYEEMTDQ